MIRKIIKIDEEKCTGCGLCAEACHEGAIEMVDGKARLTRENYCDGLGDCLPACPAGAISFEEREAPAYDAAAVEAAKKQKAAPLPCGCPGTHARRIQRAILRQFYNKTIRARLAQRHGHLLADAGIHALGHGIGKNMVKRVGDAVDDDVCVH